MVYDDYNKEFKKSEHSPKRKIVLVYLAKLDLISHHSFLKCPTYALIFTKRREADKEVYRAQLTG